MIRLAFPDIQESDVLRAVEILRSGNLVQGEEVARFEQALVGFTGIEHCAVVSSGTAALHLSLLVLGIGPGDAVVVPAFTFPATANAVEAVGAEVVLCDVHPGTYVVTPDAVESAIRRPGKGNLRAIIVVHEFGYPARIGEICAVARRHGLRVVEDAACALGTVAGGHHVGGFGDLGCFSFHPRKAVTTGEGGAVMTRDPLLIERVKELRNHGMRMADTIRDFVAAGLNYRMTEFQAALGCGQLERFPSQVNLRRMLAAHYLDLLRGDARVALPQPEPGHSWQTFMAVLGTAHNRDEVIEQLAARGIQSNLGAQAINCLSFYRAKYGLGPEDHPVAARLYSHGLALPLHGRISEADVKQVAEMLREVLVT